MCVCVFVCGCGGVVWGGVCVCVCVNICMCGKLTQVLWDMCSVLGEFKRVCGWWVFVSV